MSSVTVYTIGHSTRTIQEFIDILLRYRIELLVDIRLLPGSVRYPQFNSDNLKRSLKESGIDYVHLKGLGGLKRAKKNSINGGWRNPSFRGYADYMQTVDFDLELSKLIAYATNGKIVIMCAEAVPWRCHRSLTGDALLVRGFEVRDIFSATLAKPHKLTPFAKIKGSAITYPNNSP